MTAAMFILPGLFLFALLLRIIMGFEAHPWRAVGEIFLLAGLFIGAVVCITFGLSLLST